MPVPILLRQWGRNEEFNTDIGVDGNGWSRSSVPVEFVPKGPMFVVTMSKKEPQYFLFYVLIT